MRSRLLIVSCISACIATLPVVSHAQSSGPGEAVDENFILRWRDAVVGGSIGELQNGYLAAVGKATPEIQKMLDIQNAKRKQKHAELAARLKISEPQAGRVYACDVIKQLPPMIKYQAPDGSWHERGYGTPLLGKDCDKASL